MDHCNDEFNMHNLPSELRDIINKNVPLHEIPKVCRSSKTIRDYCKTSDFWAHYLWSTNIAKSQQKLHELLVELAKQGDIELFDYIWNTNIIIDRFSLIKEHRSLWEGFVMTLTYRKKRTAKFIEELDRDWINERAAKEVGARFVHNKDINYIEAFKLKENLIDLVVNEDFDGLVNLYKTIPNEIYTHEVTADILSHAPSLKSLTKAAAIFKYQLSLTEAPYFKPGSEKFFLRILCVRVARNNNEILFNELEDKYSDRVSDFRVNFLKSDSNIGDILATKYRDNKEITLDDYDYIKYFGNGDIALKFIKINPDLTIYTIIGSFEAMSDGDILYLLKNKCVDVGRLGWRIRAHDSGRDYLVYLIDNIINKCEKPDKY